MNNFISGPPIFLRPDLLDQNGSSILQQPVPDSPPSWTQSNPSAESMQVSADGLTVKLSALAVGVDQITVTAHFDGAPFTAQAVVTIQNIPQVPSGMRLIQPTDVGLG